jgi:SAM-dependent methyltransferase
MPLENLDSPALCAYEITAPIYDELTGHHNYELWISNLLPELEQHGLQGSALLDVACGTGKSFLPMLARGWAVTGVDISPAMLAQARSKTRGAARLQVADMRSLPDLGAFDLVWCLDDALNYLADEGELRAALDGFSRSLGPGGLCVFDLNTLAMYDGFFSEEQVTALESGRLVWRGRGDGRTEPGSGVEATLTIEDASGATVATAIHRQRHFDPVSVVDLLDAAGFEICGVSGIDSETRLRQPLASAHTKALFVTRAK